MKQIYLDYNATTPLSPVVQEAMLPFMAQHYGNPSSSHFMGRAAYEAVEDSRMHVAAAVGADRDEIFFTAGGTESNNLAILGPFIDRLPDISGHIVVSEIEHPSVHGPVNLLEKWGIRVTRVPCDSNGTVRVQDIEDAIEPDTRLVSIMHSNNEVGTLQPIAELGRLLSDRPILLHTDASQSIGKVLVNVEHLGVDLLTIAGHKLYAPKGVGALYVRVGTELDPVLRGANHEKGLRPGTENTTHIVGMGASCKMISKKIDAVTEVLEQRRDKLQYELQKSVPGLIVHGYDAQRLPNTLSVSFPGVIGQELFDNTPQIAASTGSACHSGQTILSPTLKSMGIDPQVARGTVRLSVGIQTTEDDILNAADSLIAAWQKLSSSTDRI